MARSPVRGWAARPFRRRQSLGYLPEVPFAVLDGGTPVEKQASKGRSWIWGHIAIDISRTNWASGFVPPAPATACIAWMNMFLTKLREHKFDFSPSLAANLQIASTRKVCCAWLLAPGSEVGVRVLCPLLAPHCVDDARMIIVD